MTVRIVHLKECPQAIETLAAWHHAQWGHLNPQRTFAARMETFQSHCTAEGLPATFVALEGEQVLGSASLVQCDLHQRSDLSPWLASVFVTPQSRGQGVGSAVVKQIEQHACSLGYQRLYLFTLDQQAFYSKRGWSWYADDIFRDMKIVLMTRDLGAGE